MKIKIGLVILVAVAAGLLIALFATKKSADAQRIQSAAAILEFSNQLVTASTSLDDLRQVNLILTNDLAATHQTVMVLSNNLAETSSTLATTKATLVNAEGQIVNLNGRITDLETQNKALDERASELTLKLAELDAQIAVTQQKLLVAETDNAYLTAELQKQLAQKAELQRKFNDLNAVRYQLKKLREELYTSRRLEWISQGNTASSPKKGGEVLMQRSSVSVDPASAAAVKAANKGKVAGPYDLNIEVGSDGSVHVIPPPASSPDNAAQAAARAALLKPAGGSTNAAP